MKLVTSENICHTWMISNRIGFCADIKIPPVVVKEFDMHGRALLPRGGVAYHLGTTDMSGKEEYAPGSKSSRHKQTHPRPSSSIGSMKLFCFLPLPQPSFLPVHVNGHFALDNETRHDIYNCGISDSFKSEWNQYLLRTVITRAYIAMLEELKHSIPKEPLDYEELEDSFNSFVRCLPNRPLAEVRPVLQPLQKSVYLDIINNKLQMIPIFERVARMTTCTTYPVGETIRVQWR